MNKVELVQEEETIVKITCLICRKSGNNKVFFYREIPIDLIQNILKELAETN